MALKRKTMEEIIELLKSVRDGAKYALGCLKSGDDRTFLTLMMDVEKAVRKVQDTLEPVGAELTCSQCFNIIENILYSIDNMAKRIESNDKRRGEIILEFEIIPLLAELKEDLYFFTLIYPNKERMKEYYKNEFAKNHENEYVRDGKTRFDVSLVVTAWNKLDYTKKCIESLLKYTDLKGLNCELITVNHGSSDGTEEYFESLPNEKKINFKKNMCATVSTYCGRIVESKYFVFINNDVILTTSWLENLLVCVRSDKTIAYAGPVTSNISNLQSIPVTYRNMDEMQSFAKGFNISNSDLWDERIKLCPPVSIINVEIANKIGFADRYYRFMEFSDDDAGILFRRNGYKQILLRDTFCHHFGSITLGESQKKNNTLGTSRQLFIDKHGFEPWSHGFCYELYVINALEFDKKKHVNILGIDAGLGSTPLQIKNELRHQGNRDVCLYNFTQEEQFAPDLKPYSDYFEFDKIENLKSAFDGVTFDYIYIGKNLEEYDNYKNILAVLKTKLNKGGQMVFSISNPYFAQNINSLLSFRFPDGKQRVNFIDANCLNAALQKEFSNCELMLIMQNLPSSLIPLYNSLLQANVGNKNAELLLKSSSIQFTLRG